VDDHSAGTVPVMFVWGSLIYFRVYTPPANAMNIYVVGKQWMWKAEHPGGQHEINALHVPTGRAVQLTLISQDVFHSFSIPAFRVKREAIPGRYTTVWFEPTTPGTYHLFCTQYCGTSHSAMIGDIVVLSPDDFKKWLAESTSGNSLAQNGERLFASLSCNACHNTRPDARGPSLANVYGAKLPAGKRWHGAGRRRIHPRIDPESIAACDAGLCAHHAHVSRTNQRGRCDRAG
jgi:cytochrome c oxidase subunit 2